MKFVVLYDPVVCLRQAGYLNYKKGMIKPHGKKGLNRFHAIIVNREAREIDLHYDKDQGGYHSAALKPELRCYFVQSRKILY